MKRVKRRGRFTTQYLVKWEGYDEQSWEPAKNLTNCADQLAQFRAQQETESRTRAPDVNAEDHRDDAEMDGADGDTDKPESSEECVVEAEDGHDGAEKMDGADEDKRQPEASGEYVVEAILAEKRAKCGRGYITKYLVKWEG